MDEIELENLDFDEMGMLLDGVTKGTLVFTQVALSVLSEQVLPLTPFGFLEFPKASAIDS
jgi:hypothetical protein